MKLGYTKSYMILTTHEYLHYEFILNKYLTLHSILTILTLIALSEAVTIFKER